MAEKPDKYAYKLAKLRSAMVGGGEGGDCDRHVAPGHVIVTHARQFENERRFIPLTFCDDTYRISISMNLDQHDQQDIVEIKRHIVGTDIVTYFNWVALLTEYLQSKKLYTQSASSNPSAFQNLPEDLMYYWDGSHQKTLTKTMVTNDSPELAHLQNLLSSSSEFGKFIDFGGKDQADVWTKGSDKKIVMTKEQADVQAVLASGEPVGVAVEQEEAKCKSPQQCAEFAIKMAKAKSQDIVVMTGGPTVARNYNVAAVKDKRIMAVSLKAETYFTMIGAYFAFNHIKTKLVTGFYLGMAFGSTDAHFALFEKKNDTFIPLENIDPVGNYATNSDDLGARAEKLHTLTKGQAVKGVILMGASTFAFAHNFWGKHDCKDKYTLGGDGDLWVYMGLLQKGSKWSDRSARLKSEQFPSGRNGAIMKVQDISSGGKSIARVTYTRIGSQLKNNDWISLSELNNEQFQVSNSNSSTFEVNLSSKENITKLGKKGSFKGYHQYGTYCRVGTYEPYVVAPTEGSYEWSVLELDEKASNTMITQSGGWNPGTKKPKLAYDKFPEKLQNLLKNATVWLGNRDKV